VNSRAERFIVRAAPTPTLAENDTAMLWASCGEGAEIKLNNNMKTVRLRRKDRRMGLETDDEERL
jgi:hypothetical protein